MMIDYGHLVKKANKIRLDSIELSVEYKNGHIASAFSCVEILVALYERVLGENDQFILSKGHGNLSFLAVLKDKGFLPKISGHPDIEPNEGIECTTGSLGHGMAIGVGKALARKIKKEKGAVYALIGDGECQEGVIWEAVNLIKRYQLNDMITIVDYNKLQALDSIEKVMREDNLKGKFEAFGLDTVEVDGHDFESLLEGFVEVKKSKNPVCIIAHTIKGKGISFMEQVSKWHSRMLAEEELEQALKELKGQCVKNLEKQ